MQVMDVVALLSGLTAVLGAVTALIIQLRAFRAEIIAAVERHMQVTQENQALLKQIQRNGRVGP